MVTKNVLYVRFHILKAMYLEIHTWMHKLLFCFKLKIFPLPNRPSILNIQSIEIEDIIPRMHGNIVVKVHTLIFELRSILLVLTSTHIWRSAIEESNMP